MREPIDQKKVDEFCKKISELSLQMFGRDDCGGMNMEVLVIDRTRFEQFHYQPIRYDHKPMTPAEQEWNEIALFLNMKMATDAVVQWNDLRIRKSNQKGKR